MNEEKVLKLEIRGDLFEIPSYIISQIPFFKILVETKSEDIIKIDVISSKFLKYIIDYIKNQQKPSYLKKLLNDEFDEHTIKENLQYLCMDKLTLQLYDPKYTINGMQVIESFSLNTCKLRDGQLIQTSEVDLINTLILVSKKLMSVEKTNVGFIVVKMYDKNTKHISGTSYNKSCFTELCIPADDIIWESGTKLCYMTIINYCKYDLVGSFVFTKYSNSN